MASDNGVYLFFNDSDKNSELTLDDYFNYKGLYNNRHALLTYVHLNEKGIESRYPVSTYESSFLLRAQQCGQINKNVMYLLCESGRQSLVISVGLKTAEN